MPNQAKTKLDRNAGTQEAVLGDVECVLNSVMEAVSLLSSQGASPRELSDYLSDQLTGNADTDQKILLYARRLLDLGDLGKNG